MGFDDLAVQEHVFDAKMRKDKYWIGFHDGYVGSFQRDMLERVNRLRLRGVDRKEYFGGLKDAVKLKDREAKAA